MSTFNSMDTGFFENTIPEFESSVPTWAKEEIASHTNNILNEMSFLEDILFCTREGEFDEIVRRVQSGEIDDVIELSELLYLQTIISEESVSIVRPFHSNFNGKRGSVSYSANIEFRYSNSDDMKYDVRTSREMGKTANSSMESQNPVSDLTFLLRKELNSVLLPNPNLSYEELRQRLYDSILSVVEESFESQVVVTEVLIEEVDEKKWLGPLKSTDKDTLMKKDDSIYVVPYSQLNDSGFSQIKYSSLDVSSTVRDSIRERFNSIDEQNVAVIYPGFLYAIANSRNTFICITGEEKVEWVKSNEYIDRFLSIENPEKAYHIAERILKNEEDLESLLPKREKCDGKSTEHNETDGLSDYRSRYIENLHELNASHIGDASHFFNQKGKCQWPIVGEKINVSQHQYELGNGLYLRGPTSGPFIVTTNDGRVVSSIEYSSARVTEYVEDVFFEISSEGYDKKWESKEDKTVSSRYLITAHPYTVTYLTESAGQLLRSLSRRTKEKNLKYALSEFIVPGTISVLDSEDVKQIKNYASSLEGEFNPYDDNPYVGKLLGDVLRRADEVKIERKAEKSKLFEKSDIQEVYEERKIQKFNDILGLEDFEGAIDLKSQTSLYDAQSECDSDRTVSLSRNLKAVPLEKYGSGSSCSYIVKDSSGDVKVPVPFHGYGDYGKLKSLIDGLVYPIVFCNSPESTYYLLSIDDSVVFLDSKESVENIHNFVRQNSIELLEEKFEPYISGISIPLKISSENIEKFLDSIKSENVSEREPFSIICRNNDLSRVGEYVQMDKVDDTKFTISTKESQKPPVLGEIVETRNESHLSKNLCISGINSGYGVLTNKSRIKLTIPVKLEKVIFEGLIYKLSTKHGCNLGLLVFDGGFHLIEENKVQDFKRLVETYGEDVFLYAVRQQLPPDVVKGDLCCVEENIKLQKKMVLESESDKLEEYFPTPTCGFDTERMKRKYRELEKTSSLRLERKEDKREWSILGKISTDPMVIDSEKHWPLRENHLPGNTVGELNYGVILVGNEERFVLTDSNKKVISPLVFTDWSSVYPGLVYRLEHVCGESIHVVLSGEKEVQRIGEDSATLIKFVANDAGVKSVNESLWNNEIHSGDIENIANCLRSSVPDVVDKYMDVFDEVKDYEPERARVTADENTKSDKFGGFL